MAAETDRAPRLSDLRPGQRGTVKALHCEGAVRRRLLDLGIRPKAPVEVVMESPTGDPVAYRFRGAVIALRRQDAAQIELETPAGG